MKTIIFDIDGTLADVTHRRHFVQTKPKDWKNFFANMHLDPPHQDVVALCRHFLDLDFEEGHPMVIFCTGRGEEHRQVTMTWLRDNISPAIPSSRLIMRPLRDSRADDIIKQEMLDQLREKQHDIWFVVDDRQRVVDMWRRNGITVLQCAPGDFDNADNFTYQPTPGETLLTLLVGPSGAGKTTWIRSQSVLYDEIGWSRYRKAVISTDAIRNEICGDSKDQTQNARVFAYAHDLAKTRLRFGLPVIVDATNLHHKDRMAWVRLAPKETTVEYVVIDRPLADKLREGGWRLDVKFPNPDTRQAKGINAEINLIEKHHKAFQSALKDILNGDGLPNVKVTDLRTK